MQRYFFNKQKEAVMHVRRIVLSAAALLMCLCAYRANGAAEEAGDARPLAETKKVLVAYFSHTGNTRVVAEQIHQAAGGDIFEILSEKPYPADYNACVEQARQELDSGYLPPLKTKIEDIRPYDLIFIGYPNWWSTFPAPVRAFLSENDLSGKTVVPFCTHGGGGMGRSVTDISKLCPNSPMLEGIAIPGSDVRNAQDTVREWLRRNRITK